ncbi:unnamed protein product, partial [Rotaria sp. Silwood2]
LSYCGLALRFVTVDFKLHNFILGWILYDVESQSVDNIRMFIDAQLLSYVDQLPKNVQQGRNVTFDRYFTDIKLCDALLDREMTSIGVVEHRRLF